MFNQHERAILAFKEALTLDPNLGPAQQGWQRARQKWPSHSSAGSFACESESSFDKGKITATFAVPLARLSGDN
jgi:hypothetical protein